MVAENVVSEVLLSVQTKYFGLTKQDVMAALQQFVDVYPAKDSYVFSDGTTKPVTSLSGTIPVNYKGSVYNIPICVYLLETHPYHPPLCYVRPTPDMTIKASQHVDQSGRVYLPYLHEWKHPNSDLVGLLQVMAIVFGENCPVFSRSSTTQSSQYTPYPVGGYSAMPQPASGGSASYPAYRPYGQTSTSASQLSYPIPQPSSFPSYPAAATQPTANIANNMPHSGSSQSFSGYPPYNSQQSTGSVGSGYGTITEEHIRASLLSAVEDKIRRRLRESIGSANAELQSLKNTSEELRRGERKLQEMVQRLQSEQASLESSIAQLRDCGSEIDKALASAPDGEQLDIDDAIVTTAPLFRQLLKCSAEDSSLEDALYFLGQALREKAVDLEVYLKHVRKLSREQFMLRAIMLKCRKKAALDA